MKYRVDDFMDALWRRPEVSAAVLRDPLFQMLGTSGAALVPDGIDWLEAVGRDPAIDDPLWLAKRTGAAGSPLSGSLLSGSLLYGIAPHSFARLVLPSGADGGQYRRPAAEDMALAEIDPSLVIGGTYQRGWLAVPSARELGLINAKAAAAAPGLDTAYVRVGILPLYVAVEGKNRVRAFRAAAKAITGFTCTARFPGPEALQLHEIADSPDAASSRTAPSGTAVPDVALSDESGVMRMLALPCVTVPVLEAYGARWGRTLPSDAADRSGRPLSAARRAVLEDLVTYFMHP
jgi:hypothetical protein